MIFIDGSNLYHAMKHHIGTAKLDFECFCNKLCRNERRLVHTHYYNVPVNQKEVPEKYRRQRQFFSSLEKIPYLTLHLGKLVWRSREVKCRARCKQKFSFEYCTEKGVDVSLAIHMLMHAFDNAYDTAIIVSGDGDFATAVDEVIRVGKRVENAYFKGDPKKSSYLASRCTDFIELNKKYLKDCLL